MSTDSNIEWTDATWNPVAGCSIVSPGCTNCYAMRMAARLEAMGQEKYAGTTKNANGFAVWTGTVKLDDDALNVPLGWKKPRRVFVNSMSDLFYEGVPFDFVDRVFAVMALCPQHTFQVLTKRPERMAEYLTQMMRVDPPESSRPVDVCAAHRRIRKSADAIAKERSGGGCWREHYNNLWPLPRVWLGTSVEDQKRADERIPHLLRCPAAIRFLSVEPLLSAVDLRLGSSEMIDGEYGWRRDGIHWVIVGGESGPGARPFDLAWARSIVEQCKAAGVACFVKQIGAIPTQHCSQCGKTIGKVRGGFVDACGPTHAAMITEMTRVRDSKGGDPSEWPEDLRVRQFPGMPVTEVA